MGKIIRGTRAIMDNQRRCWSTIADWIRDGAPIAMVDGAWETDEDLLYAWRRKRIEESVSEAESAKM